MNPESSRAGDAGLGGRGRSPPPARARSTTPTSRAWPWCRPACATATWAAPCRKCATWSRRQPAGHRRHHGTSAARAKSCGRPSTRWCSRSRWPSSWFYLVMASQFESLLHPFVIMFTIPLAIVGAVLAPGADRVVAVGGGVHRPDPAGGHRGEERHHPDRQGEPAARVRAWTSARPSCAAPNRACARSS